MEKRHIYLTTTLPYVNDRPHLGHALELVQADTVARTFRARGHEVFFNFGTDEHGQKILEAAKKAGEPVQAYVDRYAATFEVLRHELNLSYDAFVRTTSVHHVFAAQEMWRLCAAAGDIYKKKYAGLYCVGCERFVTEKDLVDGKCVDHAKPPVTLEEENYFFRFSRFQPYLLEYLQKPGVILPDFRREEAIKFVQIGLEDFSISRSIEKMSWGIPVPGDDSQVMYVWFDALTNYISTLGWPEDAQGNFQKFWVHGDTTQFAGKDQVRFQSLIWQAMLMSARLPTTKQVVYHGFINSGGQKMSKTIGNVLDPQELVAEYGTDAVRYFLLRHVPPFEDSDVTRELFKEVYNANLANGLGNLVSRILKMAESYGIEARSSKLEATDGQQNEIIRDSSFELQDWQRSPIQSLEPHALLDRFELGRAMDLIWEKVARLDRTIQEKKPFSVWKTDQEKAKATVCELLAGLYDVAEMLESFMPATGEKIVATIRANKMPEPIFLRKE